MMMKIGAFLWALFICVKEYIAVHVSPTIKPLAKSY